jgi:hypothetical protein
MDKMVEEGEGLYAGVGGETVDVGGGAVREGSNDD